VNNVTVRIPKAGAAAFSPINVEDKPSVSSEIATNGIVNPTASEASAMQAIRIARVAAGSIAILIDVISHWGNSYAPPAPGTGD
jgi:hypothetical protein